ncbi:hypothetical protein LCGC14_1444070 [marine sediment metagenome]|uniref:Uncharacterized protein n=1 Tax=marine sediment metagenome TaxID=412755 RepID=A0A0F9MLR1_9ZZZZ
MAKIAGALMDKLRKQTEGMRGGLIISNKTFKKMRLRLLPCGGEVPGVEYLNLYFVHKKRSTTSPRTFGVPCPVLDVLDTIRREKDKQNKDFAKSVVNVQREYWLAVVDRSALGSPDNPSIRIHRSKRTVYQGIVDYMLDEDDGEDITDATEGRDIRVRKDGSDIDTKWKMTVLDREPLAEEEDMMDALISAAKTFDVREHFYACDLELLEEIYQALTGEAIPDSYKENFGALKDFGKKSGNEKAEEGEADAGSAETTESAETKESAEAAEPAETKESAESGADEPTETGTYEGLEVGAKVKFHYTDEDDQKHEIIAVVTALTEDADSGEPAVDVKDGEGEEYTVGLAHLEVVKEEEKPKPKGAVKKKSAKPKAKSKVKPKAKPSTAASKVRSSLKKAMKKKG